MTDHIPMVYQSALDAVCARLAAEASASSAAEMAMALAATRAAEEAEERTTAASRFGFFGWLRRGDGASGASGVHRQRSFWKFTTARTAASSSPPREEEEEEEHDDGDGDADDRKGWSANLKRFFWAEWGASPVSFAGGVEAPDGDIAALLFHENDGDE